jgi:hypothetical protein
MTSPGILAGSNQMSISRCEALYPTKSTSQGVRNDMMHFSRH